MKPTWFTYEKIKLVYDGPDGDCFRIYEKRTDDFLNNYWEQMEVIHPARAVHKLFMAHAEDQKEPEKKNEPAKPEDEVPF